MNEHVKALRGLSDGLSQNGWYEAAKVAKDGADALEATQADSVTAPAGVTVAVGSQEFDLADTGARFTTADMATACGQAFREGRANPPAQAADNQPAPVRDYPPLPEPYSNIYPMNDDGFHGVCFTPKFQPGGGHPNHQPVFTVVHMRAYVDADRAAHAPADSVLNVADSVLNVADQCTATATSELAASILVDGGRGTLRQLLNDAADAIRAGWNTKR